MRFYLLHISGDKIAADLCNDVYQKAQMLTIRFYDWTSTGSVINRISGDTANIQDLMLRITQEVAVQFFLLIGIEVIMFFINWQLAPLSLILISFVVVGAKIFWKKIAPSDIRASRITSIFPSIVGFVITCGPLIIWGIGGKLVVENPSFISTGLLVSFCPIPPCFTGR